MDNITHSLVGAALGLGITDLWEGKDRKIPRTIPIVASTGANNFPDLDIVYAPITEQFGFLLHHRGHTHTFVLAPLQGGVVYLLALLLARILGVTLERGARSLVLFLSLLGPVVHLLLDSLNSYGVHPWWPFNNSWHYGDTLFIVEPWLWLLLIPYLGRDAGKLTWLLSLLGIGAVALIVFSGYVPLMMQFIIAGTSVISLMVMRRARTLRAGSLAVAVTTALFLLTFHSMSRIVKRAVGETAGEGYRLVDVIASPFPGNPFCWSYLFLKASEEALTITGGKVWLFSPHLCAKHHPLLIGKSDEVENGFKRGVITAGIVQSLSYAPLSLSQLKDLGKRCDVSAFLSFARAPLFEERDKLKVFDARFEREGRENFSAFELPIDEPISCPKLIPGWRAPREDILTE